MCMTKMCSSSEIGLTDFHDKISHISQKVFFFVLSEEAYSCLVKHLHFFRNFPECLFQREPEIRLCCLVLLVCFYYLPVLTIHPCLLQLFCSLRWCQLLTLFLTNCLELVIMQDQFLRLLLSSLSNGYLGIIHNKGIKKYECLVGTLFLLYIVRRISENTKNKKNAQERQRKRYGFFR